MAPAANVIPIRSALAWPELAAIPECYATAWSCLIEHLKVQTGQKLLVRGATSALGQAAVNIAHHLGTTVLATTRRADRAPLLRGLGAVQVLIESPDMSADVRRMCPGGIDGVLDLLGNRTFQDSLRMVRRFGQVCVAGFLGGAEPVSFDTLSGFAPGATLSFFASFMYGTPEYPLDAIPLQQMVERVERGDYRAVPVRVFPFRELPEAHRLMESNEAAGKLVAVIN